MTEVSPVSLSIKPSTLYAERPDGGSLFVDRLSKSPAKWLRNHGASALPHSIPVVVMLDSTEDRSEFCDTVALEYGDEASVLHLERAIAALQMARDALVAAGQVDFIPKSA